MKKTAAFFLLIAFVFCCLTGCGCSNTGDNENTEASKCSRYWLPSSYQLYSESSDLIKDLHYTYDAHGFISSVTGYGIWGGTKEDPFAFSTIITYDEKSGVASVQNADSDFRLNYQFDENGMLIAGSYLDGEWSQLSESELQSLEDRLWLDENGNLKMLVSRDTPVVVEKTSEYRKENDYDFDSGVNSIGYFWGSSEKNPDGTVTTKSYYADGILAEKIVWTPVESIGFWQNVYFDWDYNMGNDAPTLEIIFRG